MALVFYSKPDCPLCDDGLEIVRALARARSLDVRKVDIETDPRLVALYRYRIPVVVHDGRELGWGRLDRERLIAALDRGPDAASGDGSPPAPSPP